MTFEMWRFCDEEGNQEAEWMESVRNTKMDEETSTVDSMEASKPFGSLAQALPEERCAMLEKKGKCRKRSFEGTRPFCYPKGRGACASAVMDSMSFEMWRFCDEEGNQEAEWMESVRNTKMDEETSTVDSMEASKPFGSLAQALPEERCAMLEKKG